MIKTEIRNIKGHNMKDEKIDILDYAAAHECQELHMVTDNKTNLKGIIAIHNTKLGPALGGCRFLEYPSSAAAVVDAIRLAEAMTYKAAISNLPLGGGKMVILRPAELKDKTAFFKSVGRFIHSLNGRYITAVDSGTSPKDMDIIHSETSYVTSTTKGTFSEIDPSVMAAKGVVRGMLAALQFKLEKDSFHNVHVAIQGLGHLGYDLAKKLHSMGAKLSVFDVNAEAVKKCVKEFSAEATESLDELISLHCDIFAPCALGGILNDYTIPLLKCPIVAGSANNQLEESRHGWELMKHDILYAPDYVINAGGLIYVAAEHSEITEGLAEERINDIYTTLFEIFKRAEEEKRPTSVVADEMARERLQR